MAELSDDLRKLLATAIRDARRVAEPGAQQALESLAVHRPQFHDSMSPEDRALRNRLRAHGRQLGDTRERTGAQEVIRLAHEVAYEHWHRMLFARFLAENHLLIEPESGVPISMAECEELARDRGTHLWSLAARFAQRMLPRIFRPDDPALAVALAPETRQALERLLASLPAAVFTADDALGWTYQFWQAEKKEQINANGVKIGADELPAVTQLFTEPYMVLFLLHNTIGAWRARRILTERPELAQGAGSEGVLRDAVRLAAAGGYDFTYLRFVRTPLPGDEEGNPSGPWGPAAGPFPGWPKLAAELRVLDPCCGSGHFLVEGLELLTRLRMEEEGLEVEAALRAVLAENLFGIEIDPRCTQIAAFSVALTAWRLAARPVELPQVNIACSGLAVAATKSEWLTLADDDQRLRGGLERIHELFEKAPILGSLINPVRLLKEASARDLYLADFGEILPILDPMCDRAQAGEERVEQAVAAHGMVRAARLLGGEYSLVITNVPYLARRYHGEILRAFLEASHSDAAADLASAFLDRSRALCRMGGTIATVSPQNWLFLRTYKRFRRRLLEEDTWHFVAFLGAKAFSENRGEVVKPQLSIVSRTPPGGAQELRLLDVSLLRSPKVKAGGLIAMQARPRRQVDALRSPDSRLTAVSTSGESLIRDFAKSYQGMSTGDNPQFRRLYWESPKLSPGWRLQLGSVSPTRVIGGREYTVNFASLESDGAAYGAALRGREAWEKIGVAVRQTAPLYATVYGGECFDIGLHVIIPENPALLGPLWAYCSNDRFYLAAGELDRKRNVTTATIEQVPFEPMMWRGSEFPVAMDAEGRLLLPPCSDATQWVFHGHPAIAEPSGGLQVAVARLLGYRWPPELEPAMGLADEARTWVKRCRELDEFVEGNGIVCLSGLRGEAGASDRLRRLLAASFGADWSGERERDLLAAAAGDGRPAASLDDWLRDNFFEEHCRLFHQRPFIWHIWDGRRDGFHALVNYHRLAGLDGEGRRTLEMLTYSYLGDWIERQKAEQREGRAGADGRLAAALDLQAQLERILTGEPPCDIFVRWKPLNQQAIGWEPDINDGVRVNIRPFLSVSLRTGGRKGAGILRSKPGVDWRKDRGKEPESLRPKEDFPWFWGCPGDGPADRRTDFVGGRAFDGNRWNDLHYTNAAKRAARDRSPGTHRG